MPKKLKSRTELAKELNIHPRTLSNYMKALGIKWGKTLMPPAIWQRVLRELQCDDPSAVGGAKTRKRVSSAT